MRTLGASTSSIALVYQVLDDEHVVKVLRMWSHYEYAGQTYRAYRGRQTDQRAAPPQLIACRASGRMAPAACWRPDGHWGGNESLRQVLDVAALWVVRTSVEPIAHVSATPSLPHDQHTTITRHVFSAVSGCVRVI